MKHTIGTILITVSIICIMCIVCLVGHKQTQKPVDYTPYVVQPGDTIWSICRDNIVNADKYSLNKAVSDTCKYNNCDETIFIGQLLYIPQYESIDYIID